VDANGPEEQVVGWYYYVDDKIRFPFSGQVHRSQNRFAAQEGGNRRSPAHGTEDACSGDMLVLICWHDRTMAVPLSQLVAIDPDESTTDNGSRIFSAA